MQFLSLLYLSNIQYPNIDESIKQWPSLLVSTGIYNKYKHLNFTYLTHEDWLEKLSKRWSKEEWMNYRIWLKVVILDLYEKNNYGIIHIKSKIGC